MTPLDNPEDAEEDAGKTAAASETEIDGNLKAEFQIAIGTGKEPIKLDRIDLNVAITRVGDKAPDRLMFFLDPQESQPAFVTIRDMLKLAIPHKVLLTLENGNLSLDTWLKNKITGRIIQAPDLKRLAVANLKDFQQISAYLQKLAALQTLFRYLMARGTTFKE
ncbi:MAG: hypothetical protein VYC17_04810 [Nitrospinota bacterium]|nr:hypothetical protein [Nitrospinota bacterium]